MTKNLISANVSAQVLKFKPGGSPAEFDVTVVNESDRFASFQVEVTAAGVDANPGYRWYALSPAVSAKKPPGDSTHFHVAIADTPVPGFAGLMNLTVRIFSLELRDEERQIVRLIVQEGANYNALKLELPQREFQVYPSESIEIPVRLTNPVRQTAFVSLSFFGLEPSWALGRAERNLQLEPGELTEIRFACQPPAGSIAKIYPFAIEARNRSGAPTRIEGLLEVLPTGSVKFTCTPNEQTIPATRGSNAVTYALEFENTSNLHQQVRVDIRGKDRQKCNLELLPDTAELSPGEMSELFLTVSKQRHRWGMPQKLLLEVAPILSEPRSPNTEPPIQPIKLHVRPLVPFWLQLLGLLLLLLLMFLLLFQPDQGHVGPVTSVSFSGLADRIVSGSDDQTLRTWRVRGDRIEYGGILAPTGKAARVVRFKPVDNTLVAAGLENGEIQLWDVLSKQPEKIFGFSYQKDDRVFELEFTKDSRSLFSGHGSGLVLQWNLDRDLSENSARATQPAVMKKLDFAVYDMALVGNDEKNLAIAGRYNQLALWNFSTDKLRRLPYQAGGQDDYLTSLDVAADKPNRLASADNQGNMALWNMRECLSGEVPCEILDEWAIANDKPVRSVALSADGCYLASAGDDGRVQLWPLTSEGKRHPKFFDGVIVARLPVKVNSVDIKLAEGNIFIASGSDDYRVRLYREKLVDSDCD